MSNERLGRRALATLLALNGTMFVVELVSGWRAESMGLIADGLDMGADAAVYLLAVLALLELGRRVIMGSAPEPPTMISISLVALAANVACLALLRRHRHGEVHLQAAWIYLLGHRRAGKPRRSRRRSLRRVAQLGHP